MLAVKSAFGADDMNNDLSLKPKDAERYRANEFSADLFGTGSIGEYTITHPSGERVQENSKLGVGLGLNYFITRNIGLGADMYSENTSGPFIDSASGNVILRPPLGDSGCAPYIYGGGGHQFDMAKRWFAQLGAGFEYRFTPHIGAFIDARWVVPDQTKYYGVGRIGVRFAF